MSRPPPRSTKAEGSGTIVAASLENGANLVDRLLLYFGAQEMFIYINKNMLLFGNKDIQPVERMVRGLESLLRSPRK